jgi:hypothetical protein
MLSWSWEIMTDPTQYSHIKQYIVCFRKYSNFIAFLVSTVNYQWWWYRGMNLQAINQEVLFIRPVVTDFHEDIWVRLKHNSAPRSWASSRGSGYANDPLFGKSFELTVRINVHSEIHLPVALLALAYYTHRHILLLLKENRKNYPKKRQWWVQWGIIRCLNRV